MLTERRSIITAPQIAPPERSAPCQSPTMQLVYGDGEYDPADDGPHAGPWPAEATEPRELTLAFLEDLSTVLAAHGFPPLRGYALAELAGCLYRISRLHG